jgi:chaperonin GroES
MSANNVRQYFIREVSRVNIQPLGDRIVVKLIEQTEKTKSGIYVPDTAKDKPQEAEVLAVGPGARNDKGERIPLDVKVGDRIVFSKYGGSEIKIDGEDVMILSERDILGVIQ